MNADTLKPRNRSQYLSIIVIILVTALLNLGLYLRLAPQQPASVEATSAFQTFAFDGNALPDGWQFLSGNWVTQDGALRQTSSTGTDLIAVSNINFPNDVAYEASVDLRSESRPGGGLVFNMQTPTERQRSHMVRLNLDAGQVYVIYGYFNEVGDFIGQGSAPLPDSIDANSGVTLAAAIDIQSYSLLLNGSTVARDIPLQYRGGNAGLATSEAVTTFDNFRVQPVAPTRLNIEVAATPDAVRAETPAPQTAIDISLEPSTGEWTNRDGVITQSNPVETDFIAGLGIRTAGVRMSAEVSLGDNAVTGGGFIFHMSDREQLADAEMIRFGQGGRELFWGSYNSDAVFQGKGYAELEPRPDGSYLLEVITRTGSYDILVDGQPVATGITTARSEGWLGLISFSGPVTFSTLQLSPGDIG